MMYLHRKVVHGEWLPSSFLLYGSAQRVRAQKAAAKPHVRRGDGEKFVPTYLKNVQSKIKPEIDARRNFQRKVR